MPSSPTDLLTVIDNPAPERDYEVLCETPELTCLCPFTGQPDFADVQVRYVPDQRLVELKSLKLYLWSFRDTRTSHEAITNRLLDDLVAALAPRRMSVVTHWNVRGGITTTVSASHAAQSADAD